MSGRFRFPLWKLLLHLGNEGGSVHVQSAGQQDDRSECRLIATTLDPKDKCWIDGRVMGKPLLRKAALLAQRRNRGTEFQSNLLPVFTHMCNLGRMQAPDHCTCASKRLAWQFQGRGVGTPRFRLLLGVLPILVGLGFSGPASSANKGRDKSGALTFTDGACPTGSEWTNRPPPSPPVEHKQAPRLTADQIMANGKPEAGLLLKRLTSKLIREVEPSDGDACLERYRDTFKDPRAAYVVGARLYEDDIEQYLLVDVSARNGFGGAARTTLACSL